MYIHFPHSDYFINCPAFISNLPIPPNNQPFYPDQQTHHRSFVDSKDLLPALKEPLFFDDWAAANFKVINLPPDWLAAHQSPYQILRSDPSVPQMVQGYLEERKRRDSSFPQEHAFVFPPALRLFAWDCEEERKQKVCHGSGGCAEERQSTGVSAGSCDVLKPIRNLDIFFPTKWLIYSG